MLVDFNSNGRFDDAFAVRTDVRSADGDVYYNYGDMLIFDPGAASGLSYFGYDATVNDQQHYMAKLVNLGGTYFDVDVTPAGDRLTLEPSKVATGYVTNPNEGFRAVVYGDKGFLKVVGDESQKATLPAGKWKLLSYTIDRTGTEKPKEEKKKGSSD